MSNQLGRDGAAGVIGISEKQKDLAGHCNQKFNLDIYLLFMVKMNYTVKYHKC